MARLTATSRYNGARRDLVSVSGQAGIIANLYRFDRAAEREIIALNKRMMQRTKQIAEVIVPFDTGRMQESLTAELSAQGFTFTVKYDKAIFDRDGEPYYPYFVELGTRQHAAQPTLLPAYEVASAEYRPELRKALQRAIRRLG